MSNFKTPYFKCFEFALCKKKWKGDWRGFTVAEPINTRASGEIILNEERGEVRAYKEPCPPDNVDDWDYKQCSSFLAAIEYILFDGSEGQDG